MSLADFWYRTKLLHLSKPAGERSLYKLVRGRPASAILEIDISDGRRTGTLLNWLRHQGITPVKYAAIDPFETGGAGHLSMKDAYKMLAGYGLKPCLVPGNLASGGTRVLHTIGQCELIVCSDPSVDFSNFDLQQSVCRLLAAGGLLVAGSSERGYQLIDATKFAAPVVRKAA